VKEQLGRTNSNSHKAMMDTCKNAEAITFSLHEKFLDYWRDKMRLIVSKEASLRFEDETVDLQRGNVLIQTSKGKPLVEDAMVMLNGEVYLLEEGDRLIVEEGPKKEKELPGLDGPLPDEDEWADEYEVQGYEDAMESENVAYDIRQEIERTKESMAAVKQITDDYGCTIHDEKQLSDLRHAIIYKCTDATFVLVVDDGSRVVVTDLGDEVMTAAEALRLYNT
jgi:hypothetical protein